MSTKKSFSKRDPTSSHRSTLSLQKTEIHINVYDLLPPGRLGSFLWTLGTSLLHSGVVIKDREYAFGGHDIRNKTGVYYTTPLTSPPGATFKTSLLHGFTLRPHEEIDEIIREASKEFEGRSYNLLERNCNHFTDWLVERLTGRKAPGWLNRASRVGLALPCVVPRDWIAPPEYEDAGGELLVDEEEEERRGEDERSRILRRTGEKERGGEAQRRQRRRSSEAALVGEEDGVRLMDDDDWNSEEERRLGGSGKGKKPARDTSGRIMPEAERAPIVLR